MCNFPLERDWAMPMDNRFASEHLATWRREGVVSIPDFFTPDEVTAVRADFELVFGRSGGGAEPLVKKKDGEIGRFNKAQFSTFEAIPFDCSPALNLIGVHPALMAFGKQALATEKSAPLPMPGLGQVHRRRRLRPALPLRFQQSHSDRAVRGRQAELRHDPLLLQRRQ